MTIGWGGIGVEWGKPVFIAYVRESRYTKRSIPGRHYSTFDVMLNIAGVVLGWLISHHRAGSAGTGSANCHGADHLTPDV